MRAALRIDRPLGWREFSLASLGLIVVAALAFLPHIRHGGFYMDDWANAAGALQPPGSPNFSHALSYYAALTAYRPVLVVYVPLTYLVLGMHFAQHLILATFLAVLAAAMFYAVLRIAGLPWVHAWMIAALAVVFPWSDSTRLWATAAQVSLTATFFFAGLAVALVGLKRGSMRWHLGAAALYMLSILTYEVTLPLIAGAGLLYTQQAGWRSARVRWLMDLVIVGTGAIWVGAHTTRTASGLSGDFEHLGMIVEGGGTIMGRTGIALGHSRTALALCLMGAVLLLGLVVYLVRRRGRGAGESWRLSQWLGLSLAGVVFSALAWTMFIPADPYYTPSVYGMTNRVNGLATYGLILTAYGSLGVVGWLVGRLRPRSRLLLATATTVLLALVLFGSYVHVLRRHIAIWNSAYVAEEKAIETMLRSLPELPSGTVVFASGYPAYQAPGVPIVAATWDLNGMAKMEYDDFGVSAYPVLAGQQVACLPDGVSLAGPGAPELTVPYGSVRLIDLTSGKHSAPRDQAACAAVAGEYVPGPPLLSLTY